MNSAALLKISTLLPISLILLQIIINPITCFFSHQPSFLHKQIQTTKTSLNCICINCTYVTNCQAYNFVEKQHNQPHISKNPTFMPRDGSPTIHVNIRKDSISGGLWDNENYSKEDKPKIGDVAIEGIDRTIYEYDVVKCEDYVEDIDCWIRNMPQEIKDANPNFVPS